MIDLSKFWGSNYYGHPPLNDAAIAQAEAALGVKLPGELLTLLRVQNGGYTLGFIHPMRERTTWAEDHVPFPDLAGIIVDSNHSTSMNLLSSVELSKEWGVPPHQILLSGEGHYWVTLDYRKGPIPSVTWIDVDCGEDQQIAPSFAAFLDGLQPESQQD